MNTFSLLAELVLYVVLIVVTIYTLIFAFHWFSYGANKSTNYTALFIFLTGALALILAMFVSYQLF